MKIMKISDAIRNVERVFINLPDIVSDEVIWSFEIAIDSMKKQDPMKPYFEHGCFCSGCNSEIVLGTDYCWNCGQRLKWTED